MKILRVTFLAIGMTAAFLAADPAPALPTPTQEAALHGHMEGMKTHLKQTAVALGSKDRAQALEHIAELERLVLLAKLEEPSNLSEIGAAEQPDHITSFRRDLALVLGVLVEMEVDVLDGRFDDARARVVDPLFPMRETAHEKYQAKSE